MENGKNLILQIENRKYIEETIGEEQWVQISGNRVINGADAGFWCGLVDLDHIEEIFHDVSWDISTTRQGDPGFESGYEGCEYRKNLLGEGFESIAYYRNFYGISEDYVEVSQEFILLNNLRYDSKTKAYWAMYESGDTEEAVKYIDATTVRLKKKFLLRYAAAKQMAVVLFFDIRVNVTGSLADYQLEPFNENTRTATVFYGLWGDDMHCPSKAFSVLMGKKVIFPPPVENCGYWPYEKEKTYTDFIIGMDELGEEIQYTCDPSKLANYFGANPDAPMYLTPVFFKKEVLQKYIAKPEIYEVRDGYLSCGSLWGIEIDNHHKQWISVYLGDLGRDLPETEQSYWRSFNVVGEVSLSSVSFQRDFLNYPAESNMVDHKFQILYKRLTETWKKCRGWDLFLPLSDDDKYNLSQLRIPITDSQPEFDQLVLSLVKVLIDSLNEKELQKCNSDTTGKKGIAKLEAWLSDNGALHFEQHVQFLRDLQELRSTGTGHRKGKSYTKISAKFEVEDKNLIDVFEEILKQACEFLEFMCQFADMND